MPLTVTVIVVTLNRPACVRRCLDCISSQQPPADQIIVVDASPDDLTCKVVAEVPDVLYLRNDNGYGRMTASRNIGLQRATGDIIAFLDDDAFAHPGWLAYLLEAYTSPSIGAVGGRALNNQPGEAHLGVEEIGQLKSNGELTGYFAADPGHIIEVDHIMGCNMSFRREVLARLGGFREDYPGISGVREDSDMCMRVKRLGYRILFNPAACADHIGAPQATGKRFDTRYAYYSQRNHLVLSIRNFGLFSAITWRYVFHSVCSGTIEFVRKIGAATVRLIVIIFGTFAGIYSGVMLLAVNGRNPVRSDPDGQAIAVLLGSSDRQTPNRSQVCATPPLGNSSPMSINTIDNSFG